MSKRKQHHLEFKAKVALEALKRWSWYQSRSFECSLRLEEQGF
jgi:hypothetical protein